MEELKGFLWPVKPLSHVIIRTYLYPNKDIEYILIGTEACQN